MNNNNNINNNMNNLGTVTYINKYKEKQVANIMNDGIKCTKKNKQYNNVLHFIDCCDCKANVRLSIPKINLY